MGSMQLTERGPCSLPFVTGIHALALQYSSEVVIVAVTAPAGELVVGEFEVCAFRGTAMKCQSVLACSVIVVSPRWRYQSNPRQVLLDHWQVSAMCR